MHQRFAEPSAIGSHGSRREPIGRPAWFAMLAIALGTTAVAAAELEPDPAGADFFESKVRPLLAEHCFKCHSAQSRAPKGGLRLDSVDGLRKVVVRAPPSCRATSRPVCS